MKLSETGIAVRETDSCSPFKLAPPNPTVTLPQPSQGPDRAAGGYHLNFFDFAKNLEVHPSNNIRARGPPCTDFSALDSPHWPESKFELLHHMVLLNARRAIQ